MALFLERVKKKTREQQVAEKLWNTYTHAVALILTLPMAYFLLRQATTPVEWLSYSIFIGAMMLSFATSTIFHASYSKWRPLYRKLDHSAIYMLIIGTYAPMMLIAVGGTYGIVMFTIVCILGLSGIMLKLFYYDSIQRISIQLYVALGWLIVLAIVPIYHHIGWLGMIWLAVSALCFMSGVYFFKETKLLFSHTVWHVLVLLGSFAMYVCIYLYV
ncbi:PAQR family membrane homeostasis protein TrhA [Kurthia huakuii]|uniref:PAQR family membrane homeostasis protein TrhA n=1 Tax=Kurthia huakuii TaxID=1421019 RepID=UPI0004951481|nr:hemolysin III family protein [Kurthia huakuii]MBM7698158.1 hemolysin III [Kurthia huakuii]